MAGKKGKSGRRAKTVNEKIKLGENHKNRINTESPERIRGEMILFNDIGENGKKHLFEAAYDQQV